MILHHGDAGDVFRIVEKYLLSSLDQGWRGVRPSPLYGLLTSLMTRIIKMMTMMMSVRPLPSILTISTVFSSPSPYAWSPIQDRGDLNKQTRGDQRSRTFPHISKDFTQ